jgi:CheY-like chemotaxis protein
VLGLILVFTSDRQLRRQVVRSLRAGAFETRFASEQEALDGLGEHQRPDLLIIDCDSTSMERCDQVISMVSGWERSVPLVLLSKGGNREAVLNLFRKNEINNLLARQEVVHSIHPVLDERELLVTCKKLIQRSIFGVEKYVGSWGIVLHRATITSLADKRAFLDRFAEYLSSLECPRQIIPEMLVAAEELILNAVVHAPRTEDGRSKYDEVGPRPDLALAPGEFVEVVYVCDGQRLMVSVSDNFGMLTKSKLQDYIVLRLGDEQLEPEDKVAGAGLGLSLAFRSIHQLIVNVQSARRTEVIAGWNLRVASGNEFRRIGKSLNIFWLPAEPEEGLHSTVAA